jgi:L-arabinose isomerase
MAIAAKKVWFLTGSQEPYGPQALSKVAEQSKAVVARLIATADIPLEIVWKPVLTTADEAWLKAGGGHHHVLSTAPNVETWSDLVRMLDVDWTLLSPPQGE